jgi:phenylacetic acid degradation protein
MNAVIMDDVSIGDESLVAATAFVKSGFKCPPRSLLAGSPASVKRQLSDQEVDWKSNGTLEYQNLTKRCHASLKQVQPLAEIQLNRPRFNASNHRPK